LGASMDADLDLLLIAVFCTADDLLPKRPVNARRILNDAEVVTLCVAQQVLRISSDEQFWAMAPRRLGHLFPRLPQRPAFVKRRLRLSETIEALILEFARHSPGFEDDLLVVDSTPIECGRSVETMRRSALGDAADYGYCASHSRFFWGFRLHGLFATDGTPRALALTSPKTGEREVCLDMLARVQRTGPVTVVGDKGYAGRDFEARAAQLGARIVRPRRKDEPGRAGRCRGPPPPVVALAAGELVEAPHRRLGQLVHAGGHALDVVGGLAVRARDVARVDALEDGRQLPGAEGDIEVQLAQVAARPLRVARRQVARRREARVAPRRDAPRPIPVDHQQPD